MEDPTLAYEDMLFFERRLTEVIAGMQPRVRRWKAFLFVILMSTAYSAYYWVMDPSLKIVSLSESLARHPLFTVCISILMLLFIFFGVHKRVAAPKIIATRCRLVLGDYCLSCDEYGKLIVRPAFSPAVSPTTLTPSKQPQIQHHQQQQQQLSSAHSPYSVGNSGGSGGLDLVEEELLMDAPDASTLLRSF